jgi:hypothetical protein
MFSPALLLVSCAILGGPARAADEPPRKAPKKIVVKRAGTAGLRAFRDPETGRLREPTAEEARTLSRMARAFVRQQELEAVTHPNGMTSVDLKDAFLLDIVARRNPDGSIALDCAPVSLSISPPPAPALEEK